MIFPLIVQQIQRLHQFAFQAFLDYLFNFNFKIRNFLLELFDQNKNYYKFQLYNLCLQVYKYFSTDHFEFHLYGKISNKDLLSQKWGMTRTAHKKKENNYLNLNYRKSIEFRRYKFIQYHSYSLPLITHISQKIVCRIFIEKIFIELMWVSY